jgi:excisionase family DNA binding protein
MAILYALPEAAKLLGGISVWTLRKHVAAHHLRVTRIGRRVFLDANELERVRQEGLPSLANSVARPV